jgi:hypothetical protein
MGMVQGTVLKETKEMTNKELIQRDIAMTLDFVEQIIENPDLIDKIPEGSAITFINEVNSKIEKRSNRIQHKKYVKVKRHFEVL